VRWAGSQRCFDKQGSRQWALHHGMEWTTREIEVDFVGKRCVMDQHRWTGESALAGQEFEASCPFGGKGDMNDKHNRIVQDRYGRAVQERVAAKKRSCCGSGASVDPLVRELYASDQIAELPEEAIIASFGCGNPTALAELRPGETVLDLGSGGGIDVLLSAKRVGPTGKAYGIDTTNEMIRLAEENKARMGALNVEFIKGTIEAVPLPAGTIDVIISNCVINLSSDKQRVLSEAFRLLRPGGRFAISDIVLRRPWPEGVREAMQRSVGCVAGAILEGDYVDRLRSSGFVDISIEPFRVYSREEAVGFAARYYGGPTTWPEDALDDAVMSAFVRAKKPETSA
jgi:arsenite methyltransferase